MPAAYKDVLKVFEKDPDIKWLVENKYAGWMEKVNPESSETYREQIKIIGETNPGAAYQFAENISALGPEEQAKVLKWTWELDPYQAAEFAGGIKACLNSFPATERDVAFSFIETVADNSINLATAAVKIAPYFRTNPGELKAAEKQFGMLGPDSRLPYLNQLGTYAKAKVEQTKTVRQPYLQASPG